MKKELRNCSDVSFASVSVIMIRTMAQFVGKETEYTGLIQSIKTIYNGEGVEGFFK